jgi:hypothetical protein
MPMTRILLLCCGITGKVEAGKTMFPHLALAKEKIGQPGLYAAHTDVIRLTIFGCPLAVA